MSILVLNGPNLNLLGLREPGIYGTMTLSDIETRCRQHAQALGVAIDFRQTNHEGVMVDWIHAAPQQFRGIVINPAGLTVSSHSTMDALLGVGLPTIEVHISNIFQREGFRHASVISRAAMGVICGLGATGYCLGLSALAEHLQGDASKA